MNSMERLEPPLFETLVAWVYRITGGENLAVPRIFASFFWLIGAAFLFDLGRRMTSPWAALVGVGVFLFLPFSIRASRSFQPDPGMVMLILLTAWALYRWQDQRIWKWALLAGFFGGIAILVKIVAIFFVGGVAAGTLIYALGVAASPQAESQPQWRLTHLKSGLRNPQVWAISTLMLLPPLVYYLAGLNAPGGGSFLHWTILYRWRDLLSPSFYMRWLVFVDELLGLTLVLAALLGTLVTSARNRALLWGFWGGYLLFGLFFPYHILTHDYYHLTLVALLALSLIPLAQIVIEAATRQGRGMQVALAAVLLVFFAYHAWIGRSILVGQDFRQHPAFWQEVGEAIPPDAKAIGLSQDYGFRLMYYGWRKIALWPNSARPTDLPEIAANADYFVVTAKNQMSDQLEAYLQENYPVFAQEPGYVIFDLKNPLTPSP
ncbi:MAG TPA: hypothetical protein DEH25_12885 [Chloroflexi bacterium]|nr:hypothetical protein [Chloroflexota bacterium]